MTGSGSSSVLLYTKRKNNFLTAPPAAFFRIRCVRTPGTMGFVILFTVNSTLFRSGKCRFCISHAYGAGSHILTHGIKISPTDLLSVCRIILEQINGKQWPIFILLLFYLIISNLLSDYFYAFPTNF